MIPIIQSNNDTSAGACIGFPAETSWLAPLTPGATAEIWLVWWDRQPPGWNPPPVDGPPAPPCAWLDLAALALDVEQDLFWLGHGDTAAQQRPARLSATLVQEPGLPPELLLRARYFVGCDPVSRSRFDPPPAALRLTTDRGFGPPAETAAGASAFTEARQLRATLFIRPHGGAIERYELAGTVSQLSYFGAGLAERQYELERDGQPVDELSAADPTELRFTLRFDREALPTWAALLWFRAQPLAGDRYWPLVLDLRPTLAGLPSGSHPYAPWGVSPPTVEADPSGWMDLGDDRWSIAFELPATPPDEARIALLVVETDDGILQATSTQPLTSSPCVDLCPPTFTGSLTDYLHTYGNALQAAPLERLRSCVEVDPAAYDACRAAPWAAALRSVSVRLYWQDATHDHFLQDDTALRTPDGTWLTSPALRVELVGGQPLRYCLDFRLRADAEAPNLRSFDRAAGRNSPRPLADQDWAGREVRVEYAFTLAQEAPVPMTDELRFTQLVDVQAFTPAGGAEFYGEDGQPLLALCRETGRMRVCLPTGEMESEQVLVWLERAGGSGGEAESFAGQLPQQSHPAVVELPESSDAGRLCLTLDPRWLSEEENYRLAVILKPETA